MPPLDPGILKWFQKADSDLLNIENNLAASSIPWDTVAYHSQQAGEKYLKALIAFHEDLVPKVHDTVALPFEEPAKHWHIVEGETPEKRAGRRPAVYFYRDPKAAAGGGPGPGTAIELLVVNRIRERVASWRAAGYPGASRTTLELLQWWRRDGREKRLFFAQIEAVETVLLLVEARADFHQSVEIPREKLGEEKRAAGYAGFLRYACKMATGSGKTMSFARRRSPSGRRRRRLAAHAI